MDKLYYVELWNFGVYENKIHEIEIIKETRQMIFAKNLKTGMSLRVPKEFLVEKTSYFLRGRYIFRRSKEELLKALNNHFEVVKKSFKRTIGEIDENEND